MRLLMTRVNSKNLTLIVSSFIKTKSKWFDRESLKKIVRKRRASFQSCYEKNKMYWLVVENFQTINQHEIDSDIVKKNIRHEYRLQRVMRFVTTCLICLTFKATFFLFYKFDWINEIHMWSLIDMYVAKILYRYFDILCQNQFNSKR